MTFSDTLAFPINLKHGPALATLKVKILPLTFKYLEH